MVLSLTQSHLPLIPKKSNQKQAIEREAKYGAKALERWINTP
jgi:hypothetical protein